MQTKWGQETKGVRGAKLWEDARLNAQQGGVRRVPEEHAAESEAEAIIVVAKERP